jgi:beta-lactamase class A
MSNQKLRLAIMPLLLATVGVAQPLAAQPATQSSATAALDQQIARLAQGAGGVVGVAAWRLDGKGPRILLNGGEAFPMASTFKIAVAGKILERVDKGELKLDQMIDVPTDMLSPSEVIADRLIHPGISLSVYNLLELMLTQSDNTATDVLTKAAGPP